MADLGSDGFPKNWSEKDKNDYRKDYGEPKNRNKPLTSPKDSSPKNGGFFYKLGRAMSSARENYGRGASEEHSSPGKKAKKSAKKSKKDKTGSIGGTVVHVHVHNGGHNTGKSKKKPKKKSKSRRNSSRDFTDYYNNGPDVGGFIF